MDDEAADAPNARGDVPGGTSDNAQAHLVRAAKVPLSLGKEDAKEIGYRTRNWSLYFFFRIMTQAEMDATRDRLARAIAEHGSAAHESWLDDSVSASLTLKYDLAYPSLVNAGLVAQEMANTAAPGGQDPAAPPGADGASNPDDASRAFLNWLKVLVEAENGPVVAEAAALTSFFAAVTAEPAEPAKTAERDMRALLKRSVFEGDLSAASELARDPAAILAYLQVNYDDLLKELRNNLHAPADKLYPGPLVQVILYELLRQNAPAFAKAAPGTKSPILPAIRSESTEAGRASGSEPCDQTPVSMAFTLSGLKALKVDGVTLASFPDAFKEGMAARARRLGDTGRSAPENWEGELGLDTVNGFFGIGSNLELNDKLKESFWKRLRAEIRAFNDPVRPQGSDLRLWIGLLFRLVGLEILHIELGQDPYDVGEDRETITPLPVRKEHFGFRDGLSQPFVDLKLGATLPGGGTASRRGTWTPVAPGEIFLDRDDETGQGHLFPANPDLRKGSTFLVFRKLEQDVAGLRSFIGRQRPRDEWAQRTLAAQFVGRWPNGTPLALSPETERAVSGEAEAALNDFRYADDLAGRKCPLGAHIRRTNPRDIGGRNDVRHHRILRRGIAYGGPLLHHKTPDDGEKRGLLFIAANARIDLQFEVIQADWINGGEFLGQAGLGRCPITGTNDGSVRATFLESGATAPVRGLPSFVTTRGGDYFFAPGLAALRLMADRFAFPAAETELSLCGFSMGDAATPELFGGARLKDYGNRMLDPKKQQQVIRVEARLGTPSPTEEKADKVAFVGRYEDVVKVLWNSPVGQEVDFSVWPYRSAGRRITRGEDLLIGTDAVGSPSRERLRAILNLGWETLDSLRKPDRKPEDSDLADEVRRIAREQLDGALRRVAGGRRLDLVDDLATSATYAVIDKFFGMPGPAWLTEIAAAIPFARQHMGDIPPDWFARLTGEKPGDPGLSTMQVWTAVLTADLIANVQAQQPLQVLAKQAGAELLNYLDIKLFEGLRDAGKGPHTLVKAFLRNMRHPDIAKYYAAEADPQTRASLYLKDVAVILLEILGSALAVVPFTFASVMTALLDRRIDLAFLLPKVKSQEVWRIIYEAERLNPNVQVRVRRCEADIDLGGPDNPQPIAKGDIVAALIGAANKDEKVFPKPERFSLGEFDPFSEACLQRNPDDYLLFGVKGSNKDCWGRNRVAMPILEECIEAAGRLRGLRRVAGPGGAPQKLAGVTVGLPARFTRILSK